MTSRSSSIPSSRPPESPWESTSLFSSRAVRSMPFQNDERDDQRHDHEGQQSELEHRRPERSGVALDQSRKLYGEHEEATDRGDQANDQERLRHERVVNGHLHH